MCEKTEAMLDDLLDELAYAATPQLRLVVLASINLGQALNGMFTNSTVAMELLEDALSKFEEADGEPCDCVPCCTVDNDSDWEEELLFEDPEEDWSTPEDTFEDLEEEFEEEEEEPVKELDVLSKFLGQDVSELSTNALATKIARLQPEEQREQALRLLMTCEVLSASTQHTVRSLVADFVDLLA